MKKKKLTSFELEVFKHLPEEVRQSKFEYHDISYKIHKEEEKIERWNKKIKGWKKNLRELKKRKTELYNELIHLQKDILPTISISLSRGKRTSKYNNPSWTIIVRMRGRMFNIYLGSDKKVRLRLNEIENTTDYIDESLPSYKINKLYKTDDSNKEEMRESISKYVTPNIVKKLKELNKDLQVYEEWVKLYESKQLKGMDFLVKLEDEGTE